MVVDALGRAYVGNFGFDLMAGEPVATTTVVRVDPDGSARAVADGLCFPNGSFITPDGKTLIVNETFGNRISEFDILADGGLGPRRDWADFGALPASDDLHTLIAASAIGPDGGALDAEGALWVADAIGKRIVRVARRPHPGADRHRRTGHLRGGAGRAGWPHVVHGGRAGLHRG